MQVRDARRCRPLERARAGTKPGLWTQPSRRRMAYTRGRPRCWRISGPGRSMRSRPASALSRVPRRGAAAGCGRSQAWRTVAGRRRSTRSKRRRSTGARSSGPRAKGLVRRAARWGHPGRQRDRQFCTIETRMTIVRVDERPRVNAATRFAEVALPDHVGAPAPARWLLRPSSAARCNAWGPRVLPVRTKAGCGGYGSCRPR